jgi:hypothetical protein
MNASESSLLPVVIALSKPSISDIWAKGPLTAATSARLPAPSDTVTRSTLALFL